MKHPYLAKLLFLLLLAGLGFNARAQAQTGSISGKVLDSKGSGIPGATVLVEGSTLGSSSNVDGTFNITNVPAGPHTLTISFVGYTSARVPVTVVAGQSASANATLGENTTQLAEAVVVGYGTQRRQDITGAVATVDAKQFVQGQVTNPEQLIQGKVAGVSITSAGGAPGSASTIRIRGNTSLNANSDPLYVIDGVPVDKNGIDGASNPLSLINPSDIATFTVLKDASATAI
ncbi:MAG: carboxypeptidase-like regulatory domain-containing protein, partial [Bacteroidota bacterium]|nr:carboxypeptidase-like regulatory domain-containing protein [Bacteroidota bacterium]